MVESKRIIIKNSLQFLKDIDRKTLREFADQYLMNHSYINSFKLSADYIFDTYNLSYHHKKYIPIRNSLTHKFRFIIRDYIKLGLIEKYNSNVYIRK